MAFYYLNRIPCFAALKIFLSNSLFCCLCFYLNMEKREKQGVNFLCYCSCVIVGYLSSLFLEGKIYKNSFWLLDRKSFVSTTLYHDT